MVPRWIYFQTGERAWMHIDRAAAAAPCQDWNSTWNMQSWEIDGSSIIAGVGLTDVLGNHGQIPCRFLVTGHSMSRTPTNQLWFLRPKTRGLVYARQAPGEKKSIVKAFNTMRDRPAVTIRTTQQTSAKFGQGTLGFSLASTGREKANQSHSRAMIREAVTCIVKECSRATCTAGTQMRHFLVGKYPAILSLSMFFTERRKAPMKAHLHVLRLPSPRNSASYGHVTRLGESRETLSIV
ncbi:hypothetical protein BGW36DRAFT_428865 [Talaromyces proteolyticus]|uniref:Uncharacterized protein n=1 Tax=Talaromyces proteolyticus TaxID=1131652 RepID=A0AAD4KM57_9EURO|nr:uncharacterized protein BGW36DRAFT_428865 [Talaromyces proteolyticus]KAH8694966.1 hypothetical protein BGW36DRAFT_428865 [Talaromyces proteolyticus]